MVPWLPTFDDVEAPWREVACSLFSVWAVRTGRALRPVPVRLLSPQELMDFWADDHLDLPAPTRGDSSMHATLLSYDIVGSAAAGRDTRLQVRMRDTAHEVMKQGLRTTGVNPSKCHREGRGDGAVLVIPPDVDPCLLLDPLAHHTAAWLRHENRHSSPSTHLRIRAAVHHGHVDREPNGIAGRAVVDVARHLDAPMLKRAMAARPGADFGLVVTETLFREATQQGGLVHEGAYQRIRVNVKETRTSAWLWLPPEPHDHVPL
ncbi:hypothetical protein [Spirillospora sp. CA-294931]|uniref:hypothetical protein n=1 Tax=Spirillospora sp. CA-294931 TaxID=3240042 RepID=UPI003D944180